MNLLDRYLSVKENKKALHCQGNSLSNVEEVGIEVFDTWMNPQGHALLEVRP